MIRPFSYYDKSQVRLIWNACFGDSYEFIDDFFATHSAIEGLVCDRDGILESMLLLLPAEYKIGSQPAPFWYVYACATLPDYRKQGIMKEMLDAAYQWALKKKKVGLILTPADEALREYYKGCGFEDFSKIKTFTLDVIPVPIDKIRWSTLSMNQIRRLRRNYFGEGLIEWPAPHLKMARNMVLSTNGDMVCFDYKRNFGYAFCTLENNCLNVQEMAWNVVSNLSEFRVVANILGTYFNVNSVRFNVPETVNIEGKVEPAAMIRCQNFGYNPHNYFNLDLG